MNANQLKSDLYLYMLFVSEAIDLLKNTSGDNASDLIQEGQKAIDCIKYLLEFIR